MSAEGEAAAGRLADHLKNCMGVDAAIVQDGNADMLVAELIGAGWRYGGVQYVEGKRVRQMVPPPGWWPEGSTSGAGARPEDR